MTMRSWCKSRSRRGSRGSRLRRNGFVLGEDGIGWLVGGGGTDTDDEAKGSLMRYVTKGVVVGKDDYHRFSGS